MRPTVVMAPSRVAWRQVRTRAGRGKGRIWMFHIRGVVGTCLLLLSFAVSPGVSRFPATGVADATAATSAAPDLSALSGSFVENAGQVERGEVRYYAAVGRIGTGFAQSAVLHNIVEAPPPTEQAGPLLFMDRMTVPTPSPLLSGALVRVSFAGANPVRPQGRGETPTRSHFFLGDDPAMWRTNIRSYREVVYKDLYDGIDLVYRLLPDGLKSDFLVRPGADPARITMAYEGVDSLEVTPDRLILHTAAGDVTDGPLVATAGDPPLGGAFRPVGARRAGFDCRGWDGTHPLDIDPLFWASYLGGGLRDEAYAIDLDGAGNPVVAGYTYSTDFPATPGAYDVTYADFGDVFVAKLRPDGSSLLWVTYLGGGGADWGYGLALDGLGNAVVTGSTLSTDFPATPGAYDVTYSGAAEVFVAKLSAGGSSLLWATFLGGGGADWGSGLAPDGLGNAVVVGDTASANFPATPGAYDASFNGGPWDAFVAKLAANGSSLLWGTYLGGGDVDGGRAVALDGAGNPVVAGATFSANFPATLGAYDISSNGGGDAYVAKVGATGSSLLWATYVGGAGEDTPLAVKLDNSGNAVVAGISESTDFPTTPGAYEVTYSADFPATAGTYDMTLNGTTDAFVASLGAAGSSLLWATYLGGGSDERAHALALDGSGNAVLAGRTSSADFPATPGAYDVTYNGGLNDAFVANVGPAGPPPPPPPPPPPRAPPGGRRLGAGAARGGPRRGSRPLPDLPGTRRSPRLRGPHPCGGLRCRLSPRHRVERPGRPRRGRGAVLRHSRSRRRRNGPQPHEQHRRGLRRHLESRPHRHFAAHRVLPLGGLRRPRRGRHARGVHCRVRSRAHRVPRYHGYLAGGNLAEDDSGERVPGHPDPPRHLRLHRPPRLPHPVRRGPPLRVHTGGGPEPHRRRGGGRRHPVLDRAPEHRLHRQPGGVARDHPHRDLRRHRRPPRLPPPPHHDVHPFERPSRRGRALLLDRPARPERGTRRLHVQHRRVGEDVPDP